MTDTFSHNRDAWNRAVAQKNLWTTPVSSDVTAKAKAGIWEVVLTPTKPVPRAWFGDIAGKDLLGLASGGGQQSPIFAAAGARVAVLDASDAQLAQDQFVAERDGLAIRTVHGDMSNLGAFADASFDIVFNPCSTSFVPELAPVWKEVARVLRPGGIFMAGFTNPWFYLFDQAAFDRGELVATNTLPYSDLNLPAAAIEQKRANGEMLEFSHTLEEQIGAQLAAGFSLTHFFEDTWDDWSALHGKANAFFATRAVRIP